MLVACTAVAWALYALLRPLLSQPVLESDPIFEHQSGFGAQLRKNLRDARVVIPARPHPLPFLPMDPEYTGRITKRLTFTCSTNSDRFRGVREYTTVPAEGIVRIAVVGDSITFGHGVNDQTTYPQVLETRLGAGFEVINAGVPGQDSHRVLLDLEKRVLPFQPHVVVVCVGVNELSNSPERSDESQMQLWLSELRYWKEEQELAENLTAIEQVCVAAGVRLVLLVPPVNSFSPFPDAARFCRVVRHVAKERGLPCVDLQTEFQDAEEHNGLVLVHQQESQTVVRYQDGQPEELLTVPVSPTRQQYIADEVYDLLDAEPIAMSLSLDGSHPNARGMALIAELVQPLIVEIVEAAPSAGNPEAVP